MKCIDYLTLYKHNGKWQCSGYFCVWALATTLVQSGAYTSVCVCHANKCCLSLHTNELFTLDVRSLNAQRQDIPAYTMWNNTTRTHGLCCLRTQCTIPALVTGRVVAPNVLEARLAVVHIRWLTCTLLASTIPTNQCVHRFLAQCLVWPL